MTHKEQEKIIEFVEKYKSLGQRIKKLEKTLEILSEERDTMINELEYVREEESVFMSNLIDKYGTDIIAEKNLSSGS